ncbi:MAG: hypothetical protein D3914_12070 [Candidatus Electrothrix sp. LOE2]|nr:hypothetical protein [Candidatus Electrothrix sp. LOE2]
MNNREDRGRWRQGGTQGGYGKTACVRPTKSGNISLFSQRFQREKTTAQNNKNNGAKVKGNRAVFFCNGSLLFCIAFSERVLSLRPRKIGRDQEAYVPTKF